jgi:lactate dehydrogenase-like 2-hydroxyacid dehydrogenase
MTPKVLITRRWPEAAEEAARTRFDATLNPNDVQLSKEQLCEAMRTYDILCPTVCDKFDQEVLSTPGARVRLIANYGVGVDHIDLAAAKAAGIPVTNTPDVLTDATADTAILLMLMAARRAGEAERMVRAGRWIGWDPNQMLGQSLSGKLLGIVGFGRIGQAAAFKAKQAFGMRIAYYSRKRAAADVEQKLGAQYFASLSDLAATADVLSLHCAGGAETRNLINAEILARMKPTAIVVNTARGTVIDENALTEALTTQRIAAAGLDVFAKEPYVPEALMRLENVVLLPHIGSGTVETRTAMGLRVLANVDHFIAGKPLPDRVA